MITCGLSCTVVMLVTMDGYIKDSLSLSSVWRCPNSNVKFLIRNQKTKQNKLFSFVSFSLDVADCRDRETLYLRATFSRARNGHVDCFTFSDFLPQSEYRLVVDDSSCLCLSLPQTTT